MAFGDFTVVRSTVKYVLNSSGVLAEVAINTPAFEFNADDTYKGLLVEPAGTNLFLRSQELDNASWVKVASGAGSAPTAVLSVETIFGLPAYEITFTPGGLLSTDVALLAQGVNNASTGNHTQSYYIRSLSGTQQIRVIFAGIQQNISVGETPVRITFTANLASLATFTSGLQQRGDLTRTNGKFLITAAQFELGSVATSYIHTEASTVTRTADAVTLTGASSLIGQTEGVLYVEVSASSLSTGVTRVIASVSSATPQASTSEFYFIIDTSNNLRAQFNNSGSLQCDINFGAYVAGIQKLAFAYKDNDFAFYRNGVQVGVDASGSVGTGLDRVNFGSYLNGTLFYYNDNIRALALFSTRLTNAQLETLTTL